MNAAIHAGRAGVLTAALVALGLLLAAAPARAIDIQRVESPGGIAAWLVEDHTVPVVSMAFAFRGGTALDPEGREGLANLVSVLLDEGAGDIRSVAFQQRLSDLAIDLSFDAGVDAFYGSLKTVTPNADEAFDLLRLALTEPRFDADAVARMRAAVLAQIRSRVADPGWMTRRAWFDAAFPDHPYGRPSRGTAASLTAITIDDLRGFVDRRLARDNLVVAVTGDITPDRLGMVLDEVFGGLPAAAAPAALADTTPAAQGAEILVERAGPQSVLLVTQPGIDRLDPDYYAAHVLNHIIGGSGFTSRLNRVLREERGLTYGMYSSLADFDHASVMLAGGATSNANVEEAIAAIRDIWRDVAENGVTAAELEDARTFLTGSYPLRFTSTDRIASVLRSVQLDRLGIDYVNRRNALIEAVTLDDVNRVAAELLAPDALTVIVAGAPAGFRPELRTTAAALAERELAGGDG